MTEKSKLQKQPPPSTYVQLSYPAPHVLLVTFARPRALNALPRAAHWDLHAIFNWYDAEPSLRVAIVTGQGRAFCAGADLKEWLQLGKQGAVPQQGSARAMIFPSSGFAGLSRRRGIKPVIAAVNGFAHGGGTEAIVGCDLVYAAPSATFALPEAKRGVAAIGGVLPRIVRSIGRARAMEMVLTGRNVPAAEAVQWGLCNAVCEHDGDGEEVLGGVVGMALEAAKQIAECSPDSIVVHKAGIDMGWADGESVEQATERLVDGSWRGLESGENFKEGLLAFQEKRAPTWLPSKL